MPAPSYHSVTFTNTINGLPVSSPTTYDVIDPSTGGVAAKAPSSTKHQLDEAVAAARAAFPGWRSKTWAERKEALAGVGALLEDVDFATELAKLIAVEQGKPLGTAMREVGMGSMWIKGSMSLSLEDDTTIVNDEQSKIHSTYVPLGVTAGIIPWNLPILMIIWKIVPALMTGNTIIIKPSPFTPLSGLSFIGKIQHLFPPGVLSILSGGSELGKWITSHPDIAKVAFTGSIATGKNVLKGCVDTMKKVTLELGGNDPCIILPDVHPHKLAMSIFWSSFLNSGQICTASKRIYVHEDVYDGVLAALVGYSKQVKVGDPFQPTTMLGPVCNSTQFEFVKGLINDCHANGYKFAAGGVIDNNQPGYFIPVSIVDNPPENSRVVQEEPFGPLLPILKWKDEADVIRRANDSKTGLGASVWGKDPIALQRIAKQLEAGTVWINDAVKFIPTQPFSGHKESGFGVEHGIDGLKEWCHVKCFVLNHAVDV